jgi:chromate transporter
LHREHSVNLGRARFAPKRLADVAGCFLRLGLTSFGGPVAHLGYFREEFVRRRAWLDDAAFTDLVALCQFLPGPASSQVVFAIGLRRAGLSGALLASACFMLPSVLLMIGFAYGLTALGPLAQVGWIHGLKLAAVAVVAQAVWGMGQRLCPDWPRRTLALGAAAALLAWRSPLGPMAAIAAGALLGCWWYRGAAVPAADPAARGGRHPAAAAALGSFALLLVALPILAAATGRKSLAVAASFYRTGALVFGGGHVVLPLLRAELVPRHWISDGSFLAGYGAVQAVPGPLFTFAAYLGTRIFAGPHGWEGGLLCLAAIFLPGWLLIGGMLPFWHALRRQRPVQAALRGANAVVVGVLLAALYDPVWTQSVHTGRDAAAAVLACGLLLALRTPAWLLVLLAAAAGQWLLGTPAA